MSGALQAVFQNQRSFGPPPGQQAYTTAGSYSWVAPAGVTKVSVVVVGSGAGGKSFNNAAGGPGGGLAYVNNYSVTPGNSYTAVVGAGGIGTAFGCTACGNASYFSATCVVRATGGKNTQSCFVGGTATAGTGFTGGGGSRQGAGGAAGYAGDGGRGGNVSTCPGTSSGVAGTGGAGGGGGGGYCNCACGYARSGGGGGVGILGQSGNGAAGAGGTAGCQPGARGGGGSGGEGGSKSTTGGAYGGGGGMGDSSYSIGGNGGVGAVRIIWPGCARSFPSTRTADE